MNLNIKAPLKLIKISFFLCLFFSVISFLWSFLVNENYIKVPFFGKTYVPLIVNVEINQKNAENLHFFMDKYEVKPSLLFEGNSYLLYRSDNPVKYLYFKADDKTLNSMDNIVINLGKNLYYYNKNDILNFDKGGKNLYILPFDIKYEKSSRYINDKGEISKNSVKFLSIFYNSGFYIIPLIWLFFAILIYELNKEKFSFNFNFFKNSAIIWILILGFALRLCDINIPFWWDELYTASVAGGINEPFIRAFQDAWNPPLFYILSKIWMMIVGNAEFKCRILTVLLSTFSIYLIYVFVKRNLNKKAALLASFLFSINVYAIHSALEFRSYALQILLSLLSSYFLFKIIKYKKNRYFIIYGILAALMANTHYYQILFLANNFIFAMFYLDNKQKLKFLCVNFIGGLFLLPHFLVSGLKQGLLDESPMGLPLYDIKNTFLIFITYFGNKIAPITLILTAFIAVFEKTKKTVFNEDKKAFPLFIYSTYSILMLFISAFIFSHLVRPIIKIYYFVGITPFIAISTALIFFLPFKNKILKYIVCLIIFGNGIFCFSGRGIYIDKDDMLVIRLEEAFKYAYYDSDKYKNKKTAIFTIDKDREYANYYKPFYKNHEFIKYRFGLQTPKSIDDKIQASGADIFYIMLHKANAFDYIEYLSKKYDTSVILTDKEVIIARIIK